MTRYHVVAHHVSHLFPDVVSEPMTIFRAEEAASRIPGDLPSTVHGWTVHVERVGTGAAHAAHLYRKD